MSGCVILARRFSFHSLRCEVYLCLDDSNEQSIYNQTQEIKSMIINMLQNYNYVYSSHNSNIKYVSSTIKWINFVLSFMIFNDFDFMSISMYC